MKKSLTNREMELFRVAIHYAKKLAECNPDIGMGPFQTQIVRRVADRLSFDIEEDDLEEASEEIIGS